VHHHEFQALSAEEIARLVREAGPSVCVFPVNGTRRWLVLEHAEDAAEDFAGAYLRLGGRKYIDLCRLFFCHGVDTLLTPAFGLELLSRGSDYVQFIMAALEWLGSAPDFLEFCEEFDVRVKVYGDTQRYLTGSYARGALDALDEIVKRTASHSTHRLFIGICAHDATDFVADYAVAYENQHGCRPDRELIVEAYYGEHVPPVDIFIGFDRLAVFDMPLIATGDDDLYFTVTPSPYMDDSCLRSILYDHMYARRGHEGHYWALSEEEREWMRAYYETNSGNVVGLGMLRAGVWYPLPQVQLPGGSASSCGDSEDE